MVCYYDHQRIPSMIIYPSEKMSSASEAEVAGVLSRVRWRILWKREGDDALG